MLLAISVGAGVAVGSVSVPLPLTVRALLDPASVPPELRTIVADLRAPRVLLAALVGGGLAASGVTYQGLFRNALADPYVIGVSAGAALGAVVAIALGAGGLTVPIAAFASALCTVGLVFQIARRRGVVRMEHLLLAGLAVGAFFAALLSVVLILASGSLQQSLAWLMGGFGGRGWRHVGIATPFVVFGYVLAQLRTRELDLLLLSEDEARSMGVHVSRTRGVLIAAATLMTAASAAVAGLIGFVGLIVPHLVRRLTGPDHRVLLPASALCGGSLVVLADLAARTVAPPIEIPVGAVTALLGVPFFLWLLFRGEARAAGGGQEPDTNDPPRRPWTAG
ncbi:MAG: iron ABC transporter permease [Armatimonadota bacterium]|nr:iron ABC transporter permease [Armatimonadota bacterium]